MKWEERFAIVPSVDAEHKKLFEFLTRLHDAMKTGKGRAEIPGILDGLVDYTKTHFRNEENLLKTHGYPGFTGHQQKHLELLQDVVKKKTALEKGGSMTASEMMDFLEDWLKNHILIEDMAYKPHFLAKGVK